MSRQVSLAHLFTTRVHSGHPVSLQHRFSQDMSDQRIGCRSTIDVIRASIDGLPDVFHPLDAGWISFLSKRFNPCHLLGVF
jgi:hypothetical protein